MNLLVRFKFVVIACAAVVLCQSAAAGPISVSVLPSSPRYMEPVYLRITASGEQIYGAKVSMNGTTINVDYQYGIDIGGYSFDVMLGRFPQGSYNVSVGAPGELATAHFTVGEPVTSSSHPGPIPAVNFTDLWWDPAESGWGMSITQGPRNDLFAVWFAYDASGKPTWYTLQPGGWQWVGFTSDYSGPVYKTTGPYYGGPFDPSHVTEAPVGTATISFRDSSHGDFRYTIDGVSGTKHLERQPVE